MVTILAELVQGEPARQSGERVSLPASLLEVSEVIYRVADTSLAGLGAQPGDLLIVEPKATANTGELVLAERRGRVFVGRWWAKHGRRDLVGEDGQKVIVRDAAIAGSINLIIRSGRDDG